MQRIKGRKKEGRRKKEEGRKKEKRKKYGTIGTIVDDVALNPPVVVFPHTLAPGLCLVRRPFFHLASFSSVLLRRKAVQPLIFGLLTCVGHNAAPNEI